MFTRPEWLNTSSKRFNWTLLVVFILLAIGIAILVDGFIIPSTKTPASTSQKTSASLCQHAAKAANPVQAENNCPGTASWRADRPFGPEHAIEGFTAPVSIQIGETLKIYVSTTAPTYTFEIYRMGWYNGLGGRLMYSSSRLAGIQQPAPIIDPATRMVSCDNWRSPVHLPIPPGWVSGVYLIKLLAGKYMRYITFVLRNDQSHSAILFQTSVLTYQAYNSWGGYSLYGGPGQGEGETSTQNRAYVVSFDRPSDRADGAGDFPIYNEYNLLSWLERAGYDVSYSTDIDTDQRGATLLHHRLLIVAGHDEYWSSAMRQNVTTARDRGVSLAFFGGNDMYWHVRLQSSPLGADRELICYKVNYYRDTVVDPLTASDPAQTTALWRAAPLNMPENEVLGEMYAGITLPPVPLALTGNAQPFFAGTPFHAGSTVTGIVGGEYDHVFNNGKTPTDLSILAATPLHCLPLNACGKDVADVTLYTAASGARVFDAGTFYWGWGLDDSAFNPAEHLPPMGVTHATPAFQKFTANILSYMLR